MSSFLTLAAGKIVHATKDLHLIWTPSTNRISWHGSEFLQFDDRDRQFRIDAVLLFVDGEFPHDVAPAAAEPQRRNSVFRTLALFSLVDDHG